MTPNTKYAIAGASLFSVVIYRNLTNYLKRLVVKTGEYLRNEKGNTFFLRVQVSKLPLENFPVVNFSIDKIYLLAGDKAIAVSKEIDQTVDLSDFVQEFIPVNVENLQTIKIRPEEYYTNVKVEIVYKAFFFMKPTCQYNSKELTVQDGTFGNGTDILPTPCSCVEIH